MRYLILLTFITFSFYSCGSAEPATEPAENVTENRVSNNDLSERVIVRRAQHGIPHIYADDIEAAGYAMGYLQLEDYGDQVAELLLKARGEWAKYNELSGPERTSAINNDAVNRLEYRRAVETWQQLEPDTRQMLSGFAKGVNRYIELHPDEFDHWVKPHYTGYDVHARDIVSPSGGSIRRFLAAHKRRLQDEDQNESIGSAEQQDFYENQTVWASVASETEEPHHDAGSNVWAFSPERTTSGNAILMRNPHLSWDAGYYEARIHVPGKLDFYGDFRIGRALGIIGGFNERLGWSTTNNNPDLDEIYAFEADPDRPDHFLLDGAPVPLTHESLRIEFKHGSALGTETREFWSTPFGPVIHRGEGNIYIIKSAGDGEFRTGEQFFKMMKSQSLEEWTSAMQIRARVSSNLTYADADGNIFYVWNASLPIRPHKSGNDTTAISVTQSDEMWHYIIDWHDLPQLLNPEGGYLRNENDTFHFTNLHEILHPDDFSDGFPEPQFRLRSQLSHELIHNNQTFSLEDVVELKHSMRMLMADRVLDDLIDAVESTDPAGEIADALQLMKNWDGTVARESRGGVLFKTWWSRYVSTADTIRADSSPASVGYSADAEKLFHQPWSFENPETTPNGLADFDRAAEAFEWAVEEAKERYGHWNLPWGDVHRAVIGDTDVAVGGCTGLLGCYRVLWFTDHRDDDKKYEVRGGDGWVSAVEFGETPRAFTILAYGQSSKEVSPFYNDQLTLFANNEMTPAAFSLEEVEIQLIREYRPGANE